jgi:predicted AAA+ superfamily ATPase
MLTFASTNLQWHCKFVDILSSNLIVNRLHVYPLLIDEIQYAPELFPYLKMAVDKEKREVDLIIDSNDTLYPVEIKRTASPKLADVRHFEALAKYGLKVGKGAIVCLYDKPLPLNSTTNIIPVGCI